jgi:excisionase family DNA binding protein
MEERHAQSFGENHAPTGPLRAEDYLSVREVAKRLGVSARSVYAYIEAGKLVAVRIGASLAIHVDALRGYQRPVVGRPRTRTPVWRTPVAMNCQYLTSITVRVCQGQEKRLEQQLKAFRVGRAHLLPGTVARYVVRNKANPECLQIVLVWRRLVMPPEEEREAALAALRADLAEILDWETALSTEGQVLLSSS